MTTAQRIQFREMLTVLLEIAMRDDEELLIIHLQALELWIEKYVDIEVQEAAKPFFINLKNLTYGKN